MQIESDKKIEENDLFKVITNYNKYSANYVYMSLDLRNEVTIKSILRQLGFKHHQYNFKYHSSLCYTDDHGEFKDYIIELKRPITNIRITDIQVLGDYIVLMIDSPDLVFLQSELVKRGFEHKHADFIPHVSILTDTISGVDVHHLKQNINRFRSISLRLEKLVFDRNNIKHYE